jgi:hypothetical protein
MYGQQSPASVKQGGGIGLGKYVPDTTTMAPTASLKSPAWTHITHAVTRRLPNAQRTSRQSAAVCDDSVDLACSQLAVTVCVVRVRLESSFFV